MSFANLAYKSAGKGILAFKIMTFDIEIAATGKFIFTHTLPILEGIEFLGQTL